MCFPVVGDNHELPRGLLLSYLPGMRFVMAGDGCLVGAFMVIVLNRASTGSVPVLPVAVCYSIGEIGMCLAGVVLLSLPVAGDRNEIPRGLRLFYLYGLLVCSLQFYFVCLAGAWPRLPSLYTCHSFFVSVQTVQGPAPLLFGPRRQHVQMLQL